MTTAEQARESLRKSVAENRAQVDMTEESRLLLRDTLKDDMGDAFERGLTRAMTSENASLFVRAMFAEAQRMVAEKSVDVAGGLIKAVLMRAVTFVVLGWLVYAIGGWSALAAFVKFKTST